MSCIFESMKQEAEKAKKRGEEEVAYTIHVDGSFVTCVIRVSEINDDQDVQAMRQEVFAPWVYAGSLALPQV